MHFANIVALTFFTKVLGCGQLLPSQVPTIKFMVSSTVLPAEMAYSESNAVRALIPSINSDQQSVKTVVERLVMGAVEDVLEEQGRSAFLPYPVILQILQQLTLDITYQPIKCVVASNTVAQINGFVLAMPEGCFIISGFVTMLCNTANCNPATAGDVKLVPSNYMTFSGSLSTSNVVMANWSKQMWESVFNRVRRRLASTSSSFGTFFSTANVTIS